MQFLLKQEEFDILEPRESYDELEKSLEIVSKSITDAFCIREHKNKVYCDECPILKLFTIHRNGTRKFCQRKINCSK